MSAYNQPTESLPSFNNEVFSQPIVNLSQAEADLLYLSKTKNDISTASSTTFNGQVNVGGNITGSTLIQSNTTSVSTNRIFDNLFSGSTLTLGTNNSSNTINGNSDFSSIVSIKNKLKLSQMTNIDIDSSAFIALGFPLTEVNTIRAIGLTAATIQLPAVTLNEAGLMFHFFKFQTNLAITLTSTSKFYTLNNLGTGFTSNTTLLSTDKLMTTLMCGFYGGTERYWVEVSNYSTFDRDYNNSIYPRLSQSNIFTQANTFSNVDVGGTLGVVSGTTTNDLAISGANATYTMNAGATTATTHLFNTYTNANALKGSFQIGSTNVAVLDGLTFTCRQIRSSATSSNANEIFTNILTNAVITMGNTVSTNTIRGNTTFPQNVTIGTDGVSNDLSLKAELRCYDTTSPYTTYSKIITNGTTVYYDAPNGISTSHMFKTYNSSGVLTGSQFEVTATANISRQIHTFTNRINWSVTSYNFGSFTSNNLGYYLKATGTSQSVTSATPTTILTTSSIPIGVWRIDFSVQLTVGATGAGTITQSQSYLSTTLNGAVATAVPFTGSILRSHTSEVYANNDIQVITSSITYNQSTAGVLYLNILRTFGTGTYSFIGEVAITRLA